MEFLIAIEDVKHDWTYYKDHYFETLLDSMEEWGDVFSTPLHIAAFCGHNSFKTYLEGSKNIHVKNCIERTPLHFAFDPVHSSLFNQTLVRELLSRGADVNSVDFFGLTPLHLAMQSRLNSKEIIELLLRCGAFPDVQDRRRCPPIAYCVIREIQFLLIQYTLVKNLHTKFKQQSRYKMININDVMSLSFCKSKRKRRHLSEARQRCFDDMIRMNTDQITPNQTLFQFISERYVTSLDKEQTDSLEQIPVAVLSRYVNDIYPSCEDIYSSCLRRDELLHTLLHYLVYTKSDSRCHGVGEKTVTLNWKCVEHLAEYLSNKCIINMILAYAELKCKNTK